MQRSQKEVGLAGHVRTKPGEIWKPIDWIDGAENYFVSSEGRVRKNNKLLTQSLNRDGYKICYINLKPKPVHRLVAIAFHPNPDNLEVVDHIDENKVNNKSSNLRWVTRQQNTEFANTNRKERGEKKAYSTYQILAIDEEDNGTLYKNQADAQRGTGIDARIISQIVRGYARCVKGWTFVKLKSFTDKRENRRSK